MEKTTNDNDTWQPLSLATRRLLEACEDHEKESQRNAGRSDTDDDNADRDSENIERELEQIRARVQWLNWLEFCLNKMTRRTSRQVGRG